MPKNYNYELKCDFMLDIAVWTLFGFKCKKIIKYGVDFVIICNHRILGILVFCLRCGTYCCEALDERNVYEFFYTFQILKLCIKL